MTKSRSSSFATAGFLAFWTVICSPVIASTERGPEHQDKVAGNALTIERISAEPDTDERATTLRWSPDGARVAWLQLYRSPLKSPDKTPQQEIWTFPADGSDTKTFGQSLPANQLRADTPILLISAAKVTAGLRGTDVPIPPKLNDDDRGAAPYLLRDFAWSPDHASILLIGTQSLAWFNIASGTSKILTAGDDSLSDVSLSPDGRIISFIRNHGLWLIPAQGGKARLFTPVARKDVLEAEPDWSYRNELKLSRAYWWSPDSSRIAYLETDDRAVDKYSLFTSDGGSRQIVYPKPGGALPLVHVYVKRISDAAPLEIHLGSTKDFYLPGIKWLADSRHLAIQRIDRLQHNLDLILADSLNGTTKSLLTERDKYWINFSGDLYFFKDGQRFLWSSERSGFRHLYLYDIRGKLLTQLTQGNWEVTQLDAVDEVHSWIYFTSTQKSPLERQLYRINLDGSSQIAITQSAGTHESQFAPDSASFVDIFSTWTLPPTLSRATFGSSNSPQSEEATPAIPTDATLDSPPNPPSTNLPQLQPVELLTLKLHMGVEAHAFLIKPPSFDPAKKYPVIVYLAGGPGEQLVRDAWGGATGLWMQWMAQKGYIIFALDNQGTAGRGHYFEEPIHLRLGAQELTDQRDGILYLSSLPYVDTARLGVCGWGYGGFLVIHALLDRPVAFKAGFAGAPVTDWHFYDAVFAERYLDDPVAHADGWGASEAFENDSPRYFKGVLMVAQSSDDEFVHMNNVLLLQDRLLDAGKSADLLLFPDRGHRIEGLSARQLLFLRMTEFFLKNL